MPTDHYSYITCAFGVSINSQRRDWNRKDLFRFPGGACPFQSGIHCSFPKHFSSNVNSNVRLLFTFFDLSCSLVAIFVLQAVVVFVLDQNNRRVFMIEAIKTLWQGFNCITKNSFEVWKCYLSWDYFHHPKVSCKVHISFFHLHVHLSISMAWEPLM